MSCPMAWNAGDLLDLRNLSRIFRGFLGKNSEPDPVPQKDLQPFPFEHAWKHACIVFESK